VKELYISAYIIVFYRILTKISGYRIYLLSDITMLFKILVNLIYMKMFHTENILESQLTC